MKKFLNVILVAALLCPGLQSFAQNDIRQRNSGTVVADVLAEMPAQNASVLESNMKDLAAFAPESIRLLGEMLVPAGKGDNSRVEYALSAVAAFASADADSRTAVLDGLKAAAAAQADEYNRAFIESQIRLLGVSVPARTIPAPAPMKASRVIRAMKSSVRSCRVQALARAESYADDAFFSKLISAKRHPEADSDILYWLGERKAASCMDFIIDGLDGEYAEDAAMAAAKIGGHEAAVALCALLEGEKASVAESALRYFNGSFTDELAEVAAKASPEALGRMLSIASSRHITSMSSFAFESGNYACLAGMVTAEDAPKLASLLDSASEKDVEALSAAYIKSISYMEDACPVVMDAIAGAKNPSRFYRALASTGKDEAVDFLAARYRAGEASALDAAASMSGKKVQQLLLEGAATDSRYVPRYVELLTGESSNEVLLCRRLIEVVPLARTAEQKEAVISAMSGVALPDMLVEVERFMDDAEVSHSAALAAKSIMARGDVVIDASQLQRAAAKAKAILLANGEADDKYAVNEIDNILASHKVYPKSELTEEEKALGFEMLYDGGNLDKWIGDKDGYRSMNGVINVTAHWGLSSGNLYTAKEYRDFIYRFEFVFLEPGVNNGVGIRTPVGVDAAFDGMCECQILDHDDPIYKGLNDYQVHGSAYGIIPAKRVVHKPVGEWNEEEIEVRGMHVKVTLNGEVILDGDLSEACQGHNVAPDGTGFNPYMTDHRNHPGMFNEKGHISFCGHGSGLQFRNVRILEL
ncbi:MAG: DUF1080 domain-containing protein [Bacteroidales bacterium]|nr:DUF1080 domain-containing protein [Bacteroidales bacterium]